jgi:hypothetical protein
MNRDVENTQITFHRRNLFQLALVGFFDTNLEHRFRDIERLNSYAAVLAMKTNLI